MVTIDTSRLTEWENPDHLDEAGMDFFSRTESFRTTVDGLNGDWKGIDPHYRGVGNDELVNGLMPAVRTGNKMANAGVAADNALLALADRLRTLDSSRTTFESDVVAFEAAHGDKTVAELEPAASAEYQRLDGKAGTLQDDYESAVGTCVTALNGIQPETISADSPAELSAGDFPITAEEAFAYSAVGSTAAEVSIVKTARRGAHANRPSTAYHATAFGRHVRFLDPVMAVAADPRGAWTAITHPPQSDGRRRGPRAPYSSRISSAINGHLPERGIGAKLLDGLPIIGESRAIGSPRSATTFDGVGVRTTGAGRAFSLGGRALGTAGTVLTVGVTYTQERETETAQVAAENPAMSRQQVDERARENAAVGTAGRVGSSILASAAVGAAAGTVLPGPGNVIGFVAGLATGLAMEVPIADVDGDGQGDSLSKMAGEGLKNAWDWVRGH